MNTKTLAKIRIDVARFAMERAEGDFKFTGCPPWAKGHEKELLEGLRFYAATGAHEAIDHLMRNSILK